MPLLFLDIHILVQLQAFINSYNNKGRIFFNGNDRVIVDSWYGTIEVLLHLGGP